MPLYTLRGRLDDGILWEQIGYPCPELSTCKADADRFTTHYSCVEVRDQVTGQVVYRAVRRPKG
jgi:hypothetical protein